MNGSFKRWPIFFALHTVVSFAQSLFFALLAAVESAVLSKQVHIIYQKMGLKDSKFPSIKIFLADNMPQIV